MRPSRLAVALLSSLALAAAARADEAAPPAGSGGPAQVAVAEPIDATPWYALSDMTHLGVQLDVGAPGLAGASVVFRPWWFVRFNAGVAYDYVGWGLRGGVAFVPFHWAITPSLNFDYGRYLSGDANRFATGAGPAEQALLRNAVYDFATAQVGLELGSQRSFAFYLRGGVSYVTASASGANLSAFATEKASDPSIQVRAGDATLKSVLPCASLGFLFYVY
jgi:hypothetical protein